MAHRTVRNAYSRVVDRLNRFPQGAPPAELLFKILKILFSEHEAELISLMPIKPFSAGKAARIWKMNLPQAKKALEKLASRAILVDVELNGDTIYTLPPPMAGFFEFSLMRYRDDIDQKRLSGLFYRYLNQEEEFIRELFTRGETQLGRTFVHEPVLSAKNSLHVLDYERATEVIRSASHRAIGICYCRHKMDHLGRACQAPMEICMTFNTSAASLARHGFAREIDEAECLDLLSRAQENNLVQFGENVRERVNFICNCCGCCCEAMIAARRFALLHPVHTSNFIPVVNCQDCHGCGRCVDICPVEAMALVSANRADRKKVRNARVNEDLCLGCGLCQKACRDGAIQLELRSRREITPLDGSHRAVVMAIERGTLQHLIFDNRVLWSHRALAVVLGVILRLPLLKQALASHQIKSIYLEKMISNWQRKRDVQY